LESCLQKGGKLACDRTRGFALLPATASSKELIRAANLSVRVATKKEKKKNNQPVTHRRREYKHARFFFCFVAGILNTGFQGAGPPLVAAAQR
jgi:hypothetical protein